MMPTILGNLRINSLSRLEHLKASFASFSTLSDNWLINVRGSHRGEAIAFLKENLGDKLVLFSLLDDSRGWITNSLVMLQEAQHEYVLIWLEDHVYIAAPETLLGVVQEMSEHKVDHLGYSWWMFGRSRKVFDELASTVGLHKDVYVSYITLSKDAWSLARKAGHTFFLVSMVGIFRKEFLRDMWKKDQHRLPLFFRKMIFKIFGALTLVGFPQQGHKQIFSKINRYIFFNKLRKYPAETPFETEKDPERVDVLPFVMAFPNQELFACIDDNLDEKGYSLIERGLYPVQESAPLIASHG